MDDDATIILRYPKTQAVLMPSWNWSFSRKDSEVYGTTDTPSPSAPTSPRPLPRTRAESQITAAPLAGQNNSLDYLAAVLHGQLDPRGDLSSLDTNLVVMQILDAARRSAQTGRAVSIARLP